MKLEHQKTLQEFLYPHLATLPLCFECCFDLTKEALENTHAHNNREIMRNQYKSLPHALLFEKQLGNLRRALHSKTLSASK